MQERIFAVGVKLSQLWSGKMNILIQSPSYVAGSGGIRVLHYLGYLCHTLGHRVKMTCETLNPLWGNYSRESDKYYIRIIPEIYPVTFQDGIHTVRWVLYFPGKLCNGPTHYPDHEYVVAYHRAYVDATQKATNQKSVKVFFLPYMDMCGMNDDIPRENIGAVWHGKGPIIEPPEIKGLPIITRTWPSPRFKLIQFLKSTMTIYSFDKFTALNAEALLCGCNVMVWDGEKFEPYYQKDADEGIMEISTDLISANKFLDSIKTHFSIKDK